MIARSLLLKVMLSALALAAACGVAALFMGDSAEAGRLAGSAIVIVVACAALLKVGQADAGRGASPLHVVFTSYIGLSVLLALFLIWAANLSMQRLDRFTMGWYGMGFASLAVAWVPLMRRTQRMDDSLRLAERIALWGAAITFVIGLVLDVAINGALGGFRQVFPWVVALIGDAGALVAGCCAIALRMPNHGTSASSSERMLGITGIAAMFLSACAWLAVALIGIDPFLMGIQRDPPAWLVSGATGSFTLALSVALWCLLGLAPLTGSAAYLRHAATICTAVMGGLITGLINEAVATGRDDSMLWRVAYALAILDVCTLLAAGVLIRMGRVRRLSGAEVPPVTVANLKCPRCQHAHMATMGESVCKGCSLVIRLDFRDDLCPGCGYDMRGTPATTCAECGRARQMPHATAC
jgi:hypothetical protein